MESVAVTAVRTGTLIAPPKVLTPVKVGVAIVGALENTTLPVPVGVPTETPAILTTEVDVAPGPVPVTSPRSEVMAPLPPQSVPVPVTTPPELACRHCTMPVTLPKTKSLALKVCTALHVLAWAGFREAITAPVVGDMVRVLSLFVTELTALPVQLITPAELIVHEPLIATKAGAAPEP